MYLSQGGLTNGKKNFGSYKNSGMWSLFGAGRKKRRHHRKVFAGCAVLCRVREGAGRDQGNGDDLEKGTAGAGLCGSFRQLHAGIHQQFVYPFGLAGVQGKKYPPPAADLLRRG